MSITETILTFITNFIAAGGYPALFLLTVLDSTVLLIPSEAVMPFAGALIASGEFNLLGVAIAAIVGSIIGSLTSYAIGYYGAEPLVEKYGHWVGIKKEDLLKTYVVFEKYGDRIILASRFIPVVRHFISIPAGAAKMKLWKFIFYTLLGSSVWNGILLFLGYSLGAHSEKLKHYSAIFDKVALGFLLLFFAYLWYSKKRKK